MPVGAVAEAHSITIARPAGAQKLDVQDRPLLPDIHLDGV
jgi:hypothetical protein